MNATRRKHEPFDASDPGQVSARINADRRRREREVDDLRAVVATPEGRRVMWRMLEHCGVFRSTFTGHGARDAFNEGARNVGLFVMGELAEAEPDVITTMLKESKRDV